MEVSSKDVRDSNYFKETMDGLRTEISAARVLIPDSFAAEGWNEALTRALAIVARYAEGRGLFQMPSVEREYIHERDGKFYFWDETESEELGPYPTAEVAIQALNAYVKKLTKEPDEGSSDKPA